MKIHSLLAAFVSAALTEMWTASFGQTASWRKRQARSLWFGRKP